MSYTQRLRDFVGMWPSENGSIQRKALETFFTDSEAHGAWLITCWSVSSDIPG